MPSSALMHGQRVLAMLGADVEQGGGKAQAGDPPSLPSAMADEGYHACSCEKRKARRTDGWIQPRNGPEQETEEQECKPGPDGAEFDPDLKSGIVGMTDPQQSSLVGIDLMN